LFRDSKEWQFLPHREKKESFLLTCTAIAVGRRSNLKRAGISHSKTMQQNKETIVLKFHSMKNSLTVTVP
jgi:hypothetical protein